MNNNPVKYQFFKSGMLPAVLAIFLIGLILNSSINSSDKNFMDSNESDSNLLLEWNQLFTKLESSDRYATNVSSARFIYTLNLVALIASENYRKTKNKNNYGYIQLCSQNYAQENASDLVFSEVLNSALAQALHFIFNERIPESDELISHKESEILKKIGSGDPAYNNSKEREIGKNIATLVCSELLNVKYIKSPYFIHKDSIYSNNSCNKESNYSQNWIVSTLFYDSALNNNDKIDFEIIDPVAYSNQKKSRFYSEALEVYTMSQPLSEESKWIAEFWSDDHPGITFSPVTRWLSVSNQIISKEKPDFDKTLDTYFRLGLALNEAAAFCWPMKYNDLKERPAVFIKRFIDPNWQPFHESPAFPAFPSGHATFGAAACGILENIYGTDYQITDRSHQGKKEFKSDSRSFNSIKSMAIENAASRMYLGVHFRSDCEEGLKLGFQIATHINNLQLKYNSDNHNEKSNVISAIFTR